MSFKNIYLISASILVLTSTANASGNILDINNSLNRSPLFTSTLELKPISQIDKSYKSAKIQFLPNVIDSEFKFGSNADYNDSDNCPGYLLKACPAAAICTYCSMDPSRKKIVGCNAGFNLTGDTCTATSCEAGGYKSTIPNNQICTKITTSGMSCYKDCRAISCSGYSLNCDTFTVANATAKEKCPDCTSADANCSPKLCKVDSCEAGYRIAENSTQCIALNDVCLTGYYKKCETGNLGEPQYTERGTACYQCKTKVLTCSEQGLVDVQACYNDAGKNYGPASAWTASNMGL